ncbi:hypothetical protein [Sphingomonas crocodyli]|uniref:Uncharacterized protein n=1 Tax=Sphingomonas crocodyli TaxID=1979270 RepID=A0A437M5A7_9SPHN|nr:hypothetical protein [Sphingomonas crocodyli]RVT92832.1 hypothetical protein EOD43_02640 [Sphingomonas crocodyli]
MTLKLSSKWKSQIDRFWLPRKGLGAQRQIGQLFGAMTLYENPYEAEHERVENPDDHERPEADTNPALSTTHPAMKAQAITGHDARWMLDEEAAGVPTPTLWLIPSYRKICPLRMGMDAGVQT